MQSLSIAFLRYFLFFCLSITSLTPTPTYMFLYPVYAFHSVPSLLCVFLHIVSSCHLSVSSQNWNAKKALPVIYLSNQYLMNTATHRSPEIIIFNGLGSLGFLFTLEAVLAIADSMQNCKCCFCLLKKKKML